FLEAILSYLDSDRFAHVVANAPETTESRARMPPSMNAHGYDTPDLTKEELTDKGISSSKFPSSLNSTNSGVVIETLYDIVRRAESSSHKPSRAVLTAYNEYLNEQGLLPSDDAVLHRFLFRIQQDERKD